MRQVCFKRYPGLRDEILEFERDDKKKGVVAFLLDTLIDAENLGFEDQGRTRSRSTLDRGRGLGGVNNDLEMADLGQGQQRGCPPPTSR